MRRLSGIRKYFPMVGMIWLVALLCFAWGAAMIKYEVFPYHIVYPTTKEVVLFWKGDPADKRSIWQRLRATLTNDPLAFAVTPTPFPIETQLNPVDLSVYQGPNVQYLDRAQYYSDTSQKGYFLIFGSFGFENSNWGVILISSKGQILRTWSIKPDEYEFPGGHIGMALSNTGDIATNTNGVLTSYNWCGKKNWEAEWQKPSQQYNQNGVRGYNYHHDINYYDGKFHTFLGTDIVSVDEITGKIVQRIHAVDLIQSARDQDLAIFDARFLKFYKADELNRERLAELTVEDPFHFNKVEVLSHDLKSSFDMFKEGDMIVSMLALNLVFVFRPKTSKVLWYRYGLTSRQHDATFQRGYISVFDNNPFANSGNSPRIVALNVNDHSRSVLFDLRKWGAKMEVKGNFEFDDDSRRLMFSDDDNGRAVVGDLSGKPIFIFENSFEPGKNLQLRNITQVAPEKIEEWSLKCN